MRGSLKRLKSEEDSLGISELLAIAGLLENTNRVKAYSRNERGDAREDSLDGMFESLEPLTLNPSQPKSAAASFPRTKSVTTPVPV